MKTADEKNMYKETEAILYAYPGYKIAIQRNNEKIEEIKQHGPFERLNRSNGISVQGGIKEFGGIPEEELRQIEHIKNENLKLEKRILRVDNALIHLEDDAYFELISLRYFEKLSIESIAIEMSKSPRTIGRNRTRLVNILQTLIYSELILGF